jgi:hypothetical protein
MKHPQQLGVGFDAIQEQQETAHLPSEIKQGIEHYRGMLEKHNVAMLAGDENGAAAIQKEARRLATKLNDGEPGILAGPEAPGYVLMNATAAAPGTVPIWGQQGEFDVKVGDTPVHIRMDGMLGIGRLCSIWPGFDATVVEPDNPFISETGFRSFIGDQVKLVPVLTPDMFAREVIASYIKGECRGKLRPVKTGISRTLLTRRIRFVFRLHATRACICHAPHYTLRRTLTSKPKEDNHGSIQRTTQRRRTGGLGIGSPPRSHGQGRQC